MNRTDRLLAIVLELQAKKTARAEDLAATFEVSKRTIYRDMLALDESGVPIVSMPGQGYSLVDGYFLPPLTFSSDEAIMLLLGTDVMAQNFDAQYRGAAQSANHKIVAVLPESLRREVEYLESSIQFIELNTLSPLDALRLLRQAIIQRRTVRFRYHARQAGEISLRDADPYALIHIADAWILVAYCHLRHDIRHFRLDRMETVALLEKGFNRPTDYRIQLSSQEDRTVIVEALFDHETARRVRETPSYYQVSQEERDDGVLITLMVRQPADVLNWLLSWGSHVRVLVPATLRDMLATEAREVLQNHRSNIG